VLLYTDYHLVLDLAPVYHSALYISL